MQNELCEAAHARKARHIRRLLQEVLAQRQRVQSCRCQVLPEPQDDDRASACCAANAANNRAFDRLCASPQTGRCRVRLQVRQMTCECEEVGLERCQAIGSQIQRLHMD